MQIILLTYYLIALIAALILLKAYRSETTIGKKIGRVMLATFFVVVFYSFNMIGPTSLVKSVAISLSFIASDIMMFLFFQYVVCFIDWDNKYVRALQAFFAIFIVADIILLLINPFQNIVMSFEKYSISSSYFLSYIPNSLFVFHNMLLSIMVLFAVALLLIKCMETPKIYWKRYYILIVGMIVILFVNISCFYLTQYIPLDITGALYCILGIVMYFNTFCYLPGVTLNITRRMILGYLNEPIVLFDYEGKLVDYSMDIKDLLPNTNFLIATLTIDKFIKQGDFRGFSNYDRNQEFEWSAIIKGEIHIFQCKFICMKDECEKEIGKIFIFHDITEVRKTYFELERSMLYDAVTGFYNKQSYLNKITQWNNMNCWPVAVGVCNINGLKNINEKLGTNYGDQIMKNLAYIIRTNIGEETFAAKIDNGDIVVIQESKNQEDAAAVLEAVKQEVESFFGTRNAIQMEYGIAVKDCDAITVERAVMDARISMQNKKMLREDSASSSLVGSLKQTLSESDYETEEHVERTREMAARFGRAMNMSDSEIGKLELLAVLHDIGKVAIPQHVLVKKGKLNDEEFQIMKQHTLKGYRIAKSSPELGDIADCILSHHEKWDGTGYPNQLKGANIPLLARIISVVDSHDVMVHDRPYHKAMSEEAAIIELNRCAGTQFDPNIVEKFIEFLEREELNKIDKKVSVEQENVNARNGI